METPLPYTVEWWKQHKLPASAALGSVALVGLIITRAVHGHHEEDPATRMDLEHDDDIDS